MKRLLIIIICTGLLSGCGERSSEKYDRWMSELDCPVVLIGKTDKASNLRSIVVRDGAGRVRTIAEDNYDGWKMPSAITESRNIGDTLKPCAPVLSSTQQVKSTRTWKAGQE